jgi:hypothetical protein
MGKEEAKGGPGADLEGMCLIIYGRHMGLILPHKMRIQCRKLAFGVAYFIGNL